MTEREHEIRTRYTRVVTLGGKKVLFLHIDNQEFEIVITPRRSKWYQIMLGKALAKMIDREASCG